MDAQRTDEDGDNDNGKRTYDDGEMDGRTTTTQTDDDDDDDWTMDTQRDRRRGQGGRIFRDDGGEGLGVGLVMISTWLARLSARVAENCI